MIALTPPQWAPRPLHCVSCDFLSRRCWLSGAGEGQFVNWASINKLNVLSCLAERWQDTINAIEGLTEYSLLAKQLHLNMDINVSYKHKGDFYHYKVTEKNFLGRPVEVIEIFCSQMGEFKSSLASLLYVCFYLLCKRALSGGQRHVSRVPITSQAPVIHEEEQRSECMSCRGATRSKLTEVVCSRGVNMSTCMN